LVVEANKRANKTTKAVLLKTSDAGKEGDMVEVSNGFFRSYLEPQGLATKVSAELMAEFEKKAAEAAAAKAKEIADAKALCTALTTIGKFTVKKTVGEDQKIFGSVTAADVVEAIKAQTGKELEKSAFAVPDVSTTGVYEVVAQFHKSARCTFKVEVQKA
jgi:large subunit ribosomal protein L9